MRDAGGAGGRRPPASQKPPLAPDAALVERLANEYFHDAPAADPASAAPKGDLLRGHDASEEAASLAATPPSGAAGGIAPPAPTAPAPPGHGAAGAPAAVPPAPAGGFDLSALQGLLGPALGALPSLGLGAAGGLLAPVGAVAGPEAARVPPAGTPGGDVPHPTPSRASPSDAAMPVPPSAATPEIRGEPDPFDAIVAHLMSGQTLPGTLLAPPAAGPSGAPALPTSADDLRALLALPAEPRRAAEPAPAAQGAPEYYFLPHEGVNAPPEGSGEPSGLDPHAVRRDFPILHQKVHGRPLIWMDNAATTQKPRAVIDAISRFYERDYSNIHRAAHTLAARATEAYENAREKIRRFLGAQTAEEIVYVRGTTEAINLVAQAWGRKNVGPGDEILLTEIEHHANIVPWQMLAREKGAKLKVVPIDDRGVVLMEEYARLLGPRTRIVGVTQVSNALGTVVPVHEMVELAHRRGVPVLVDGAQSVPHVRVDVTSMGADFFVFSGHKVYGPTGVGALYVRREIMEDMPPWQGGGNMIQAVTFDHTTYSAPPAKFEAGTPTITDAVGLGAAIDYVERLGVENIAAHEHALTEYAMERLHEVPGIRLIGTAPGKVSVLSFVFPGTKPEDVGRYLDGHGIAVRAGHHCAMPTMQHFGLTGTVRPSLGVYNTREEVDCLVDALKKFPRS